MPSGNYLYSLSLSATFSLAPPNIDTSILTAKFMFGLSGNQVLFSERHVVVVVLVIVVVVVLLTVFFPLLS